MSYLTEEEVRRLKSLIVNVGLNIGAVAIKMNMSRSTLSAKINGKADFTRSEMERFAEVIGSPPNEIFFVA